MSEETDLFEERPEVPETTSSSEAPPRYLFTVDGDEPREVLTIVCDLVVDADAELLLGAPVTVPEQTPLDADQPRSRGERLVAKVGMEANSRCGDRVSSISETVRVGRHRDSAVAGMVDAFGITTLIEESIPETGFRSIFDGKYDEPGVGDTCDVITVSRISHLTSIDSILVPIDAGPHSGLAIDIALSLAKQNDADLELLHVEDASASPEDRRGEQILAKGTERTNGSDSVTRTLLESDSVSQQIVNYSNDHDITVMGAPREGLLKQFVSGTIPSEVSEQATGTVLTAHRAGVESSWLDRWV